MIHCSLGFTEDEADTVARLYWQAFSGKLISVMGPEAKAHRFITSVLDPSHAIVARNEAGQLLGVVGFKTLQGALVGGGFSDMRASYGMFGAIWRSVAVSMLERDVDNTRFLMDGIFVSSDARGQGVGTALLDAICNEARTRNYPSVRLDVIDTNPRAHALYERYGFKEVGQTSIGPLRYIFGFNVATTMVKPV